MQIQRTGEVAVLRIDTGKGNAMSRAFLDAAGAAFDELAASDARATVITGVGKFFSAGLALPELIDLPRDDMRAFMAYFDDVMGRLYALPMPTVAAVNGHAIAGGCVLAIQCDTRIMADRGKIGLTEVTLGIGLPGGIVEALRHLVPGGSLFSIAMAGTLFDPADALRVGLVDEVVAADEVETTAMARAESLAGLGKAAYAQVKAALRRPVIERTIMTRDAELERWLDTWFSDEGQTKLRAAVAKLS